MTLLHFLRYLLPDYANPSSSAAMETPPILHELGLEALADRVREHRRMSITLEPAPEAESLDRGGSRLGGAPDLPPGFIWPERDGEPLAFLAQLNLGEFPLRAELSDLPHEGLLYFFYDLNRNPTGASPDHRHGWHVAFSDEDMRTFWTDPIPDMVETERLPVLPIQPVLRSSYPTDLDFGRLGIELTDSEHNSLARQDVSSPEEFIIHKVFGYADAIQREVELDCQLASHGITVTDDLDLESDEVAEHLPSRSDWLLLLQLDSDDRAGMHWGDTGRLYFCIRKNDLAARRFENIWCVMQSY